MKISRNLYHILFPKIIRNKIRVIICKVRFFICINLNCDIHKKFKNRICPDFCKKDAKDNDIIIWHPHGIFINKAVEFGNKCQIVGSCTIGSWKGVPKIKNNVFIGSGAVLIGNIVIGNNVKIGANATVTKSVPDNCTVIEFNKVINKNE